MRIFHLFFADMSSRSEVHYLEYIYSSCNLAAAWQMQHCSTERIPSCPARRQESWEPRRSQHGPVLIGSLDSTWVGLRPMGHISLASLSADLRPKSLECEFVRQ